MSADLKTEQVETKRDRVRRLLIDPMARELGFRFPKGTDPERATAHLNRVADYVWRLDDLQIGSLRVALRTQGQGSAKTFWPEVATFLWYAERVHNQPLGEIPELLRWFQSVAGKAAQDGGRLIEEYDFWTRKKRPPMNDRERKMITDQVAENQRRQDLIDDRNRRSFPNSPEDMAWAKERANRKSYVENLIETSTGGAT